jgi:Flp pilus assembly pilin Flp
VEEENQPRTERYSVKQKFWEFLVCESGQTTTEYVLILAVIITIFMQFRRHMIATITKLFGKMDPIIDQAVCTDVSSC